MQILNTLHEGKQLDHIAVTSLLHSFLFLITYTIRFFLFFIY